MRWLVVVALALGGFALLARYVVVPLLFWRLAESCERPRYEVVRTLLTQSAGGRPLTVEVRRYEAYVVAEVNCPRGLSEQQRRRFGFQQVAGYIFGKNVRRKAGLVGRWLPRPVAVALGQDAEKISMTAPVQSETLTSPAGGEVETVVVSFTMPSKYRTVTDLPVPLNRNVTFRAVPSHYAAAVGFRGPPPSASKIVEMQLAIKAALADAGLRPARGRGTFVYQYHDPFATPRLLRWNEVVLLVEDGDIGQELVH